MSQWHELIDIQKQQILALEPHYSYANIGVQLNISCSTITSFLRYTRIQYSIKNLPRPERLLKTSATVDCYIICIAKIQTQILFKELRNIINVNISI